MHGSEAVAWPTGTCTKAETIVKPDMVERAATGVTRKPGTIEVSVQKEIDVDRFQLPKSAAGTRVQQGPSTESISDARLRTLE